MEYPKEMEEFRSEIKELSKYLCELKENDNLHLMDYKKITPIFNNIIKKIELEDNPKFAENMAEIFIYNLNNLYKEIGNHLAVENEEMLAVMVLTTFRNVIAGILAMKDAN